MYYGRGHVSGNVTYDEVALLGAIGRSVNLRMLAINYAEDLAGTQADGILGLSPEPVSGAESLVKKLVSQDVIDAAEFTVFLGVTGQASYIDFGKYKGNTENVTWVSLTDTNYWRVYMKSMEYKNKPISILSSKAVLDTGSSVLGMPREDLKNVIFAVKEDRQLFYLEDINFYGVR